MKVNRPTLVWILGSVSALMSQAACVVSSDDDDDGTLSQSGTTDSVGSATLTGGPGPDCVNIMQDPGFEQGTPNPYWESSSSASVTLICDGTCSNDAAAQPRAGAWWVWFGGIEEAATSSVSQTLTFSRAATELRFFYMLWPGSATGDDSLTVRIDDVVVHSMTDEQMQSTSIYSEVVVNVANFADGAPHTVTFQAATSGLGSSSIFLDDVTLYDCGGTAGTTGTTGTTSTGSTTDDTESSGGTTGESSTGGESSSSSSGSESSSTGVAEESSGSSSGGSTGGSSGESSTGAASEESSSSGAPDASTGSESGTGAESSTGAA